MSELVAYVDASERGRQKPTIGGGKRVLRNLGKLDPERAGRHESQLSRTGSPCVFRCSADASPRDRPSPVVLDGAPQGGGWP